MEVSGLLVERFVKFVTDQDLVSDEMRVPSGFTLKHGNRVPPNLFLEFRNGYRVAVTFNKEFSKIFGVQCLYEDCQIDVGCMFLFEFNGQDGFNVYVIGRDLCEMNTPSVLHQLQKCSPRKVRLAKGGLRCVKFLSVDSPIVDELSVSGRFIDICLRKMSLRCFVDYVLSNGKTISGGYSDASQTFIGFGPVGQYLGIGDLNVFNMLLLTYEGYGKLSVSLFDDSFVEVLSPGTPLSPVVSLPLPTVESKFEVKIKPSHLLRYCYGVDISVEFKTMWHMWSKTDYITVYSRNASWKLQIRHRKKWERTTIHNGWVQFKDDMGLGVGDLCVFECPRNSYTHFSVRVLKNLS